MGVWNWIKGALAPRKLTTGTPVVGSRPLHEQYQRIGGGLTPQQVSWIIAEADAGNPARLIDLANESRQKDGHLQSVAGTRDGAVAQCDLDFVVPERPTIKSTGPNKRKGKKDQRAVRLCRRVVDDFENWPALVEHLSSSWFPGHATAEIFWKKTSDGLLLPYKAKPIFPRNFVFSQNAGELRYVPTVGSSIEVDLLADNPGRIVQLQRRIVGDVPAREGLLRLLVWSALFRNWTFRDWIALGEVAWKPWRLGKYKAGTHQSDIDKLTQALEDIGANGVGTFPEDADVTIEWPKGNQSSSRGTHIELYEAIGREMSKAVLGQTTSVESGPNGDRAATQTRDQIRLDKREQDAVAVAAALKSHLFSWVVRVNLGEDVLVPTPWFQTDEAVDQVQFATMVEKLAPFMRIPARWVRDETGMPEPKEGDELLSGMEANEDGAEEDADNDGDDGDDDEPSGGNDSDDAEDEEAEDDDSE